MRRPCLDCRALIPTGSVCRPCAKVRDARRPTAAQRGYGTAWRPVRLAQLEREPLCRMCGGFATDVDHIVERRLGGGDEPANLRSLCHSCHSRRTALASSRIWER